MSGKGDAGRLPRMACRARQLESDGKPPGLDGGGDGAEIDCRVWWRTSKGNADGRSIARFNEEPGDAQRW